MERMVYVECSCGGEVVKIEYDKEVDSYYFAVFTLDGRRSWRNRLRQIWHIIRTGEPYSDNAVISSNDMNRVVEFIDQINKDKDE